MGFSLIDYVPNAYFGYVFIKSPFWYKVVGSLAVVFLLIVAGYGYKMYKDSFRFHNFFIPNIQIFVEKVYNERTLSFNLESLSEVPAYINQVQIAIYNIDNKKEYLYRATKHGIVNPLKKGDILPFSFVLDSPFEKTFNFSKAIKTNKFMCQVYKIIVVVYYNKINFHNIEEQRFEYFYDVSKNKEKINGSIREVPNPLNDSARIYKKIPYEINQ